MHVIISFDMKMEYATSQSIESENGNKPITTWDFKVILQTIQQMLNTFADQ